MNYKIILLLILFGLMSCKSAIYPIQDRSSSGLLNSISYDTAFFHLQAYDLSEDMSQLSSGNDELIILSYASIDNKLLGPPLLSEEVTFDSSTVSHYFSFALPSLLSFDLFLILIERDSDRSIEQIESAIRVYSDKIKEAHDKLDYTEIERYLGDEDVLAYLEVKKFKIEDQIVSSVKGISKMDKYDYSLRSVNPADSKSSKSSR